MKYLSLLAFTLLFLITTPACKKEVPGCMDSAAENYNADATEDNGSCVYARDKFIGTFVGTLNCEAPLPNDEGFTMTFAEGLNNGDEVEISFQNTQAPIPVLTGKVNGNTIVIEPMETSIALDPNKPDEKTNLEFSGEAVLNDAGNTLAGTINVKVVLLGQTLSCTFSADKQ